MPQPKVGVEPTDDGELWQRLVDSTEGATAYLDWDWLDFQQDLLGIVVERHVVLADDEPVGVFPVPRRSRRSFDSPYVPFPYVGPLTTPETLVGAVAAMRRRQVRSGLVLARFDVGPPFGDAAAAAALRTTGADAHEDATVVVELTHDSPDALLASFSSARRADVRRARRDGSAVRDPQPGEVAELLPIVLRESYEAHGKPSPYPREVGERFEQWMAGRSWAHAWVATVHGEPAGVITALGRHPVAVGWVGGAFRRFRSSNPSVLLYQRVLEVCMAEGCTRLDSSGWVDDGVAKYKLGFGGERVEYLSVESSLVPEAARRGLQRAKAFVRR